MSDRDTAPRPAAPASLDTARLDAETRRGLWTELVTLEDWLAGGARRPRQEPDFQAAAEAAESGGEASAGGADARDRGGEAARGAERLPTLCEEVARCAACRLASGRSRAVFGEGSPRPLVLVVGEGPGEEEDATGRPFVGPAGQLLDKMLSSIGLSRRTNCYIANVVKCRPPMNRDPAPDEQAACLGYLRRQVEALRPSYVLCLGRVAAQALSGSREGIGALRGRWLEFEGLPLLATYHPSALLRDESWKRPAWEDLKLLRSRMEADGAVPPAAASGGAPGAD